MDLPTDPKVLAQAQAFFDAYDAIPEEKRLASIRQVASDQGLDFRTAFRWAVLDRPRAQTAGDSWPYYDEDEEPAELPTPVADGIKRAQQKRHEEDDSGGETIADIKELIAAGMTDMGSLLAVGNAEALEEVEPVARAEGKAIFLEEQDVYVAFVSPRKPPFIVPRATHERMQAAYSNYDGHPVDVKDIAAMAEMTPGEFRQYKRAFGWTRDMLPKTGIELAYMDEEEAIDEMANVSEAALRQKFLEHARRADHRDAEHLRNLDQFVLSRFERAIANVPQFKQKAPIVRLSQDPSYNIILPLNDWQVGSFADSEQLRFGRQFDRHVFDRMIDDYIAQLVEYIERHDVDWGTPYLVILGDILHGMIGETMHGTKLAKHMREFDWEQCEVALNAMMRIADVVVEFFGAAKLIGLPGNHEGYVATLLTKVLEQRYSTLGTVSAVLPRSRTHFEMIGNNLFVFDHGASPDSNTKGGKIARTGPRRDLQVKDLVYTRADLVAKARQHRGGVYFVMGDQHHSVDESPAGVEIIKLPALPSGDVYADENGWYSRPAQGLLLVGTDGLKHFERIYLDNKRVFPDEN